MTKKTMGDYLDLHAGEHPDRVWLRERRGDEFTERSWQQCRDEIHAAAAWLEKRHGSGANMALLSKNRPHWFLADIAIILSGNVTVPLFTTLSQRHSKYILDFAEVSVLILGETANWDAVRAALPENVEIVTLPGVDCELPSTRWDDIVSEFAGQSPGYQPGYDDLVSIVFTSGTTGVPKGVEQTHRSFFEPVIRFQKKVELPEHVKAFSYLPLAHIAERNLVEVYSVFNGTEVTFNESLETLGRDLRDASPHYLFGAPRVWEQLQQGVIASFGSSENLEAALANDHENVARQIRENVGLQNALYLVTGAAPAPPSILDWYHRIGLNLTEGYGQTEAMGLIGALPDDTRRGSIGKPIDGVEIRLGENDELLVRADGLSPGYYKQPEKTAELWQNDWLHTGDKARIDEDGFVFLLGRVKEYFKTIHGKFVSPAPIENTFAACGIVEQLCLLGRGYSKTVMVCVLNKETDGMSRDETEQRLRTQVEKSNENLYPHARIGAVIAMREPWTIENGILTPTLKVRRDKVEQRFGEQAEQLGRSAAETGQIRIAWA